jgi:quercetin dioxygenase-like cupin family protein
MQTLTRLIAATMIAGSVGASADEIISAPVRSILERHDQSNVGGKEIVLGTAALPAGSAIGFHVHPGDEAGYVLIGNLILKVKGQPDRTLKSGDTFFNPRGLIHSLLAAPGTDGGIAVSTWIVDKDKPLATSVQP